MNEGGSAAQGVPVRQDSVAEVDGLAVLLLSSATPFGEPVENEARICDSDEERSIGRVGESSSRRGKFGVSTSQEERGRKLRREKETVSSPVRRQNRAWEESSRARAHIGRTRFGSEMFVPPSREHEKTGLGFSREKPTATRKGGAGSREG